MTNLWTEKYRPKDFENFAGQPEITKRIKAMIENQNIPHMIFCGPAGVGKTTLSLIIAKQLFKDTWRENFLELNASDERGIDIIRVKVKEFARTKALNTSLPKIILLDEADALTRDAQQALRRTMETYSNTARMILSCVTPDTKILLPDEREIEIKDFFKGFEDNPDLGAVQNINKERSNSKNDSVLASVRLPASSIGKKVLEITTMSGKKIKVTSDHNLLTTNGWKEAGELNTDDQLLIYSNLEGTPYEYNPHQILAKEDFVKFVHSTESKLKRINETSNYKKLKSNGKKRVLQRIKELKNLIKEDRGITPRQFEIYSIIKDSKTITRKELGFRSSLSYPGVNYLLYPLIKKGYVLRLKHGVYGVSQDLEPMILRNNMDIKRIIEKEFKINISFTLVQKSDQKKIRCRLDYVMDELDKRRLLDLTYNDTEKLGALSRLCGFMLGDGHLVKNNIRLHFSGNKAALKKVQEDLEILGFDNYSNIRSVKLKNTLKGRSFSGVSTSFFIDSIALSLLLQHLGVPKGDKVTTSYLIPSFIKFGTKFVKREFIRSLFGCDADKPNYKKMNFGALSLRQNKSINLKENMLNFYSEISEMLLEFDVKSYHKIRDLKEIRKKDKMKVLTFSLTIKPTNFNLQKYFSRIGYAYEDDKIILARLASEYLRHKSYLIKKQKNLGEIAVSLVDNGGGIWETANSLGVSPDFVSGQVKGKRASLPRNSFMNFDDWIQKYKYNNILIKNDIESITETRNEVVMDITCKNDHNFISNGFVSHNCNYFSKLIDPIKSRCAVFKFKPLSFDQISDIITKICKNESITISDDAKQLLFESSRGDLRRIENMLQTASIITKDIKPEHITQIVSKAEPKDIKEILTLAAIDKNFVDARKKLLYTMTQEGLSGLDIIPEFQRQVWNLENLDNNTKLEIIEACAETEFRIVEGSDEFLQIEALLARFCKK